MLFTIQLHPGLNLTILKKKTQKGISLLQSQKGPQMYKRGHGVMEATSLYIQYMYGLLISKIKIFMQ